MTEEKMKKHKTTRLVLRIIGLLSTIGGVIFLIQAINKFADLFEGNEQPGFIFEFAIAMPLLLIGIACLMITFIGPMSRFVANEGLPVAKDSANYMIKGTKDAIVDVVNEIKDTSSKKECPVCRTLNDLDQNYCGKCGAKLN